MTSPAFELDASSIAAPGDILAKRRRIGRVAGTWPTVALASVREAMASLYRDRTIPQPLDAGAVQLDCQRLGEAGTLHALSLIGGSEAGRADPVAFLHAHARTISLDVHFSGSQPRSSTAASSSSSASRVPSDSGACALHR